LGLDGERMSLALIPGAVWVILAAITALLPMRRQFGPGFALLLCAPLLIAWIGWQHGGGWMCFAVFALASMFRRPLVYLFHLGPGLPVCDPPDPEKDPA